MEENNLLPKKFIEVSTRKLASKNNPPKLSIKLTRLFVNLLALPLIPLLFILKKIWGIKFVRVRGERIGHLAGNTEVFLRRIKLGLEDPKMKPIGITGKKLSNEQLFKMFKREMRMIQYPQSKYLKGLLHLFLKHTILSRLNLVEDFNWWNKDLYYELNNCSPCINFTEEEEIKGKQFLQKIGINDKPFICFHARDSSYLNSQWTKGDDYHSHRNCSIDNYMKAVDYLAGKGLFMLRVGSVVEEKIINENKKIVDYATKYRNDFADIYLPAKCKFFLGNTAGFFMVSTIFNVPVAFANAIPLVNPPLGKDDLFIPKKLWSLKDNRFLTFKEIINSNIINFNKYDFEKADINVIENTPQEILDLAIEMNQRLDGNWETTGEDEQLQAKYKSLFPKNSVCYGFSSQIGALFLRKNKQLLE